ncbi:hypothetical protein CAP2UW1_3728 [Candidatus Accumulibacter phosphatis]|uniref:Uncharacterized protein n=1 Tax=Accumulibacter regalis TaxID=522306 RepID=C7RKR0_ACCRE
MNTQMRETPSRPPVSPSIEGDLDSYLDTTTDATAVFRSAVDVYLQNGAVGACWHQAKLITEHLRTLEDLQARIETGGSSVSALGRPFPAMAELTIGVTRLLKDMRRQITAFAIEAGFSNPGRRVPSHLLLDMQELSDQVCATVGALVDSYRPSTRWWEQGSAGGTKRYVSRYESQADRLSTQLIKKIFADGTLNLEVQLPLAQLVEEIDRLADHAESIDRNVRTGKRGGRASAGNRRRRHSR